MPQSSGLERLTPQSLGLECSMPYSSLVKCIVWQFGSRVVQFVDLQFLAQYSHYDQIIQRSCRVDSRSNFSIRFTSNSLFKSIFCVSISSMYYSIKCDYSSCSHYFYQIGFFCILYLVQFSFILEKDQKSQNYSLTLFRKMSK